MEEILRGSLPWIFLYVPLAVLAALCVLCLAKLPGTRRRGLLPVAACLAVCVAVLFGGAWLLGALGLEWRMAPKLVLGCIVWGLGLAAGILTARYTARWLREHRPKLKVPGLTLALWCLVSAMGAGTVLGGVWAAVPAEQVGTWQGQTVVQGTLGLLKETYEVYEYRGPFVRGAEPLAGSGEPMLEESVQRQQAQGVEWAEQSLGVSLSDGTVLKYSDTHGGFLGDGETFLVISFEGQPEWAADWRPLPLTENLALVNSNLADGFFPDAEQGCYFFQDRHSESTGPADDSQLFNRSSLNFTLAVYDSGTDTLYYYELDT